MGSIRWSGVWEYLSLSLEPYCIVCSTTEGAGRQMHALTGCLFRGKSMVRHST